MASRSPKIKPEQPALKQMEPPARPPKRLPKASKKAAETPAAAQPTPDQSKLSVSLPPSKCVVVLGIDANGALYHHLLGPNMSHIEAAGLLAYGNKVVDRLLEATLPAAPQRPQGAPHQH